MKKRSILFTINLIFVVSFLLVSLSFFALYDISQKKSKHMQQKRAADISRIFLHECRFGGMTPELIEEIEMLGFSVVQKKEEIEAILNNPKLKRVRLPERKREILDHFELEDRHLIYINTPLTHAILQDNTQTNKYRAFSVAVYLFIVFVFGFFYFSLIQKLKPLGVLKDKVKNLGEEEFDIAIDTKSEDEIAQLAEEFYKSAQKLKRLKEARNVFIRNIMHELKTPIAKGKFLLELPKNETNDEKMHKVFYRLESLINEFAAIEELISTKKVLEKKEYLFEELLDNAIDLLMCDEDEVQKEFASFKIAVDFKLFSIALKNLLDNAIKYAPDSKAEVLYDRGNIVFQNRSEPLAYALESYFEPFFKGDEVQSNQSFGLGLYIVKHILDAHGFGFFYEYKEGKSRFIIQTKGVA
jgi:two-component system OmpR family sensor kinase